MTLVVETGAGTDPLANTYIDDAFFVAYCDARGLTYPATPTEREPLIISAKDYVDSFRKRYQGYKTTGTQPLQWPRSGVYVDGYLLAPDAIPSDLQNGQAQAAFQAISGNLQANTSTGIKRERVDVLEVEYENGGSGANQTFAAVDAWLESLFVQSAFLLNPVR